jgi:hypothetical protein
MAISERGQGEQEARKTWSGKQKKSLIYERPETLANANMLRQIIEKQGEGNFLFGIILSPCFLPHLKTHLNALLYLSCLGHRPRTWR